jgi:hypothetical protein
MHVLDISHLEKKHEYFGDALEITKRLGLYHLMGIRCHFYATLSFENDEAITFKWMTSNTMHQSNFYEFAKLLNYGFQGHSVPVGHHVHHYGAHLDKKRLAPLYFYKGTIGTIDGLLPL